ncbi:hypothetical protein RI578_40460 (plasmid) [Streptomyces sp. BB1-1-1]|uniref:hypothetical protein n=1 Tax=Streptomyces sp. BB1-1-1 TaxID=3074430 RepID=UPI0013C274BF|nr:hypothetical protein [Streptomyces sp. BB1-1-1]NEE31823.1 hypothetical protein [Streptomyces sp. SID7982]WND40566.1 hypothetical protein RI578_40460 [Streptomyces sp. BB1-1-1]
MTDRIVGAPINAPLRDLVEHLVRDDNRTGSEPEPDTTPAIPAPSTGGVSWR